MHLQPNEIFNTNLSDTSKFSREDLPWGEPKRIGLLEQGIYVDGVFELATQK
jgi:hypothetical protein